MKSHAAALAITLLAALLAPLAGGCMTGSSELTRVQFRSLDTGKRYAQQFDNAAYARTDSGQVQVVMTDLGQGARRAAPPGQPLEPSLDAPLKQILTLRVLWRPPRSAKPDELTSTNAAIDWYVVEDSAGAAPQWLHYSGSGFVRVDASSDVGSVEVRNATLTLADRAGEMDDPLGRVDVSGSFNARRDAKLVETVLGDVRERYTRAMPPGSEHQGPPPRAPAGP